MQGEILCFAMDCKITIHGFTLRLMSNTYARCPMEKSKGHWTFCLSNGSLIVHWTLACPLDPMDKWNFHRTFALSVGQLTCL